MNIADFDYDLPSSQIAQAPTAERSASRLLDASRGDLIQDRIFAELPSILKSDDLLIMNNTRVLPARLFGRKAGNGGRVEILIERLIGRRECIAQIRASKAPRSGSRLVSDTGTEFLVDDWGSGFKRLRLVGEKDLKLVLELEGHVPLPPYIRRAVAPEDRDRYQTVYACESGAVAAPTAGLHFDHELLAELQGRGIRIEYLTLHVGAGTFQPIRVADFRNYQLHSEWVSVSERVVEAIAETRFRGGSVVAIGTTVVRALESAARTGQLVPKIGDTDLFITPGFRFRVVDILITNFHLPRSSLLVLVSAFAGLEEIRKIYAHAIEQKYRFYSYGDAMRIERKRGRREI